MRLTAFVLCLSGFLVAATLPSAAQPSRDAARPRKAVPLPRPDVMELATRAFHCAWKRDQVRRPVLTVIDYSLPSAEPRLWVIDMAAGRVLFHELVAHGRHSGEARASRFSNDHGSKQSSLGLFRAEETYLGQHGYSLRMSGLEPGVNDNARDRAIVMHGAGYVSHSHIAEHGRLGRSWGCPTLPREVSRQVIDSIKDGSVLFAYYPDDDWLRASSFLRCDSEPL
jgi:hypothetical protein